MARASTSTNVRIRSPFLRHLRIASPFRPPMIDECKISFRLSASFIHSPKTHLMRALSYRLGHAREPRLALAVGKRIWSKTLSQPVSCRAGKLKSLKLARQLARHTSPHDSPAHQTLRKVCITVYYFLSKQSESAEALSNL